MRKSKSWNSIDNAHVLLDGTAFASLNAHVENMLEAAGMAQFADASYYQKLYEVEMSLLRDHDWHQVPKNRPLYRRAQASYARSVSLTAHDVVKSATRVKMKADAVTFSILRIKRNITGNAREMKRNGHRLALNENIASITKRMCQ